MKEQSRKTKIVDELVSELNIPKLYREYSWKNDTWKAGFPDICALEAEISKAAKMQTINLDHLQAVAGWGGLPNKDRIRCNSPISIRLYDNGRPVKWLESEPDYAIRVLQSHVRGFGPTYLSKLLRFAVPEKFGALDTRLVRVFGFGDLAVQQVPLIDLRATPIDGRWAILKSQAGWPSEYATWITILSRIAGVLNEQHIECPHPSLMIHQGLRHKGLWIPADVEMALFSYASKRIRVE